MKSALQKHFTGSASSAELQLEIHGNHLKTKSALWSLGVVRWARSRDSVSKHVIERQPTRSMDIQKSTDILGSWRLVGWLGLLPNLSGHLWTPPLLRAQVPPPKKLRIRLYLGIQ